ncbi:hypothetical protein ACTFIW_008676 [Dictyostelium discoideum]
MLRSTDFWKDEGETSLMLQEKGFIKSEGIENIFERTSKWFELVGLKKEEIKIVEFSTDEPERIFVLDAERTFSNDINKKKLVKILTHLKKEFGDYQQGLSFVASFLMLTMDESENVALMTKINSMLPGYWKHEAIDFGTSAFTLYHILQQTHPSITKHLENNCIDAGTFCQKWFLGLCVHLLPFRYLFQFFEKFLVGGVEYLYKFSLALFTVLEKRILDAKNPQVIFAILRLDESEIKDEEIFQQILDRSDQIDISTFDLKEISKDVYERNLKKRIESAHKVHANVEEIEDCQWCLDNFPEFYCLECKQLVCQDCLDDTPTGPNETHQEDSHTLISMEEYENNRDKYKQPKSTTVEKLTKDLEDLKV